MCRLCREQAAPLSIPCPVTKEWGLPERPDVQVQKFRRASGEGKERRSWRRETRVVTEIKASLVLLHAVTSSARSCNKIEPTDLGGLAWTLNIKGSHHEDPKKSDCPVRNINTKHSTWCPSLSKTLGINLKFAWQVFDINICVQRAQSGTLQDFWGLRQI